jgi:hypothetical protein
LHRKKKKEIKGLDFSKETCRKFWSNYGGAFTPISNRLVKGSKEKKKKEA